MSDFSFLKTGTYDDKSYEETILKQALSLYMVFTEDAMRIAGAYVVHLGGKVVKDVPMMKALKIRALHGDTFWNQPGLQQRLKDTEKELNELLDEETSENLHIAEAPLTKEMLDFQLRTDCPCDLCKCFNEINDKWKTWVPQTEIDTRLKTMIDKAHRQVYGN